MSWWRFSGAVARKELREAVRDRRALASALLYAVWGPLVMGLALVALARDRGAESPLTVAIDPQAAPALSSFLTERAVKVIPPPEDVAAAIRTKRLPVAVVVDDTYAEEFLQTRPALVTILFDGSWNDSKNRAARVRTLLAEYGRRVSDTRLILRGVSPASVAALRLEEHDLSTAADRAATLLGMLPIFLLLSAFIGGIGASADMMAGERERGSLEPLLLHPVPRSAIVAGKWAAASVLGLVTVTLTLAAAQAVLRHPRIQAFDVPIGLSTFEAAQMWTILAPLALLVTAVQVLIALLAGTYKEAHTQLSLMIFLPMLPGFLFAFGNIDPRPWMWLTPMIGQHVMIAELLRGQQATAAAAALLTAVTFAACALALTATAHLLTREAIVRRNAG